MRILGVDPGGKSTGFAVIDTERRGEHGRHDRIWSQTIVRSGPIESLLPVDVSYLDRVRAALLHIGSEFSPDVVAIEGVKRPNWHAGGAAANPEALLATGIVLGWCMDIARWSIATTIEVPPGGNGSGAFLSYPEELVSDAERRRPSWRLQKAGEGKLRHERSAYDVARVAIQQIVTSKGTTR